MPEQWKMLILFVVLDQIATNCTCMTSPCVTILLLLFYSYNIIVNPNSACIGQLYTLYLTPYIRNITKFQQQIRCTNDPGSLWTITPQLHWLQDNKVNIARIDSYLMNCIPQARHNCNIAIWIRYTLFTVRYLRYLLILQANRLYFSYLVPITADYRQRRSLR